MMVIDNKYKIGDTVYIKTDKDQSARLITGILVNPNGITYRVSFGERETWQYEIELNIEKDFLIATTN